MNGRTHTMFFLLLTALLAGCRESANAPLGPPISPDGQIHQSLWAGSRTFSVARGPGGGSDGAVAPVDAMEGSFWAFTDRDAVYGIDVQLSDGTSHRYVTVYVPRGSLFRRPDGAAFAFRDSIEITVAPNPEALRVELGPNGLVFNPLNPARLVMSYQEADGDFNDDGVIDQVDDYIGQVLLGLSTQPFAGAPWTRLPSINDVMAKQLSARLYHFTGYAVSW